jgi:hypothetical protein
MGLPSDEKVVGNMAIRVAGRPLYLTSNLGRKMTSLSVLIAMDSFDGVISTRRAGAYNSTNHFVEPLKTFSLKSGEDLLLQNVVIHHSGCVRAFADSIGLELRFIPLYATMFYPIEGLFSIVNRNDRSTRRIAEAFNTR